MQATLLRSGNETERSFLQRRSRAVQTNCALCICTAPQMAHWPAGALMLRKGLLRPRIEDAPARANRHSSSSCRTVLFQLFMFAVAYDQWFFANVYKKPVFAWEDNSRFFCCCGGLPVLCNHACNQGVIHQGQMWEDQSLNFFLKASMINTTHFQISRSSESICKEKFEASQLHFEL